MQYSRAQLTNTAGKKSSSPCVSSKLSTPLSALSHIPWAFLSLSPPSTFLPLKLSCQRASQLAYACLLDTLCSQYRDSVTLRGWVIPPNLAITRANDQINIYIYTHTHTTIKPQITSYQHITVGRMVVDNQQFHYERNEEIKVLPKPCQKTGQCWKWWQAWWSHAWCLITEWLPAKGSWAARGGRNDGTKEPWEKEANTKL